MQSPDRAEPLGSRPARIFLLLVLLAFAAVNFAGLGWYPMPHCDEIDLIVMSRNFFREGRFAVDYFADLSIYYENFATRGHLYQAGKGLLMELIGYTAAGGRVFSWIGWLLAILFTFLAGRRLFGASAGLAAAVIMAASNNAFYSSHIGREEIWVAAAGAGLFYYYLVVRSAPTRLRHAFLGLLMALLLGIHANMVWYNLPLGLLILYDNYRTAEGRVRILLVGAAALLGAGLVVAMQLLPDVEAALRSVRFEASVNSLLASGFARRLPGQLALMQSYYLTNLNGSVAVATAYFLLGTGYAIYRRTSGDRLLLAAWGLSLLGFTFLMAHKSPFYSVIWEPLLAMLAGAGVVRLGISLSERRPSLGVARPVVFLMAPLLIANLASQVWLTVKFSPRNLDRYLAEVRDQVPPASRVLGDPVLWFIFRDGYDFTADTYFDRCIAAGICPDRDAQEFARILNTLAVEYVVEDGAVGCTTSPNRVSEVWAATVEESCTLVGVVEDRWFGAYGQEGRGRETRIYDCTAR